MKNLKVLFYLYNYLQSYYTYSKYYYGKLKVKY